MGVFTDQIEATTGADRAALQQIRDIALLVAPEAVEDVSYGAAGLRYRGKGLLAVAVASGHLSLYPQSAAVVAAVSDDLPGFRLTKGSIHFTGERPIPEAVLERTVRLRLAEIDSAS